MTPLVQNNKMIRYGTAADQRFISQFKEEFNTVVVNGNMLAHMPAAMAEFLGQNSKELSFLVDPLTHAFQHDIDLLKSKQDTNGEIKRSIKRLVEAYGQPIDSAIARNETIIPNDFEDEKLAMAFGENVIKFQIDTINEYTSKKKIGKYLEYVGTHSVKPAGVIPPYFYMEPGTIEDWISVNTRFLNYDYKQKYKLYAQLVISKDILLDSNLRDKLIRHYTDTKCDAILLWVDDMPETSTSEKVLSGFVHLLEGFKQKKKPVYNLFGGYFSVLLMKLGLLDGVCNGLEYGEHRPVVPVGGGIPTSKYYYYPLHKRLRYVDAVKLLQFEEIIGSDNGYERHERYFQEICDCKGCEKTLQGDIDNFYKYGESDPITFIRKNQNVTLNYPTTETKRRCLIHYLHCKIKEHNSSPKNLPDILNSLEDLKNKYVRLLGLSELAYISTWKRLLDEKLGE